MLLHDVPVDAVGIPWEQWMEQQRERIFAEARAKRPTACGPAALAASPMLQETTHLPPVSAVQAALPMHPLVRAEEENDMDAQPEPCIQAGKTKSSGAVCPCWRTGRYVWNNRCPSHLVKNPFHFSLEKLQRLVDLVNNAESLDNVWPILDRLRAARD